jgi:hypothetical protein
MSTEVDDLTPIYRAIVEAECGQGRVESFALASMTRVRLAARRDCAFYWRLVGPGKETLFGALIRIDDSIPPNEIRLERDGNIVGTIVFSNL